MKPQLPAEIAALFPDAVVKRIHAYVPPLPKPSAATVAGCTVSPSLERALRKLQTSVLNGTSEVYLRGLEDFLVS